MSNQKIRIIFIVFVLIIILFSTYTKIKLSWPIRFLSNGGKNNEGKNKVKVIEKLFKSNDLQLILDSKYSRLWQNSDFYSYQYLNNTKMIVQKTDYVVESIEKILKFYGQKSKETLFYLFFCITFISNNSTR